MTIVTSRYIRKPLFVEAVQVTEENFVEIAKWCQGEINDKTTDERVDVELDDVINVDDLYIHVRVHNPKNARQTQARVGDWLLYTERGYKVYTHKAFKNAFDEVEAIKNGTDMTPENSKAVDDRLPHPEPKVQPDGGVFHA